MMTTRHLLRLQSHTRALIRWSALLRCQVSDFPKVTDPPRGLRNYGLFKSVLPKSYFVPNHSYCADARKSPRIQATSECSKASTENDEKISVVDSDGKQHKLGEVIATKLFLSFTCTVCDGSNSYTISKQAYQSGVVIVTCLSCRNNHLIADNLGWFEDIKHKNIEEIMEAKGEKVRKFLSSDVKEFTIDANTVDTKS